MKKYIFLIGILTYANTFSTPRYEADHLEQFKKTNSCSNCDLISVELSWTNHKNALLTGTDLSKAKLHYSTFEQADFTSALLIRTQASNAKFMNATFDGANLLYLDGRGSQFSGAFLRNCNLNHAYLSQSNFSKADLTGTSLVNADLSHAILIGTKIVEEQLKQVKKLECAVLPNGTVYNPTNSTCRYL